MQAQLLELKTQIIADVASTKRAVFAALFAVTLAQAALIVGALLFV